MLNITNEIRNVSVKKIQKTRDVALGVPQKDVAKYVKIVSDYGNVVPATVAEDGDAYLLIDGSARLEACTRAGIKDMPVVIAQTAGETEKIKLSLLLSASREQGCSLSEGAMIEKLTKEHGLTLGELSKIVGKSKSWLSRRQTLNRNLSPSLCVMILNGDICTRTAEEIAKLPRDEQALFAANVVKDGLSKDDVHALVLMYRLPDATIELCDAIIKSPSDVLPTCPRGGKTRKSRSKRTAEGRISGAARLAVNILDEIGKMVVEYTDTDILTAQSHLLLLRKKMQVLAKLIISRVDVDVSPGKREVIQND